MDLIKQLNSKQKIINAITDVVLSSTSHGIPNIIKSKNILIKLMWIFFTLISSGACAFMIADSIISFFKFEVTTKTRVVSEHNSNFPTVTICNINYFTSNYSAKWIENYHEFYYLANPFTNILIREAISLSKISDNQNNRTLFGDSLQKFIVYCSYEEEPCNLNEFKYFSHPRYGNCYQFNSGYDLNEKKINLKKTILSDRSYGLKLILNTSVHEDLKFMNPNLGAVILIHNETTYPMMVDEITIAPKMETNIALSRTFYKSEKKPYSNCDGNTNDINSYDSDYYKLVHHKSKEYSHNLCYHQCIQKYFLNKCNCHYSSIPSLFNSNVCTYFTDYNCSIKALIDLEQNNYIEKECTEKCPLECEGMWFDKTISFSKYSNPFFENSLSNYKARDSVYFNQTVNSEDLAVVNIFYKSLSYTLITENPTITIIGLFSSLGGITGLFLGASVLTFVELIEILMQIFLVLKNKNNKILENN